MGIESRYRHSLVVKRMVATGALDGYGQPVMEEATVATVRGLIQPRSAREVALTNQAGAVIGQHVGYMAPLAGLGTDCWIELRHATGRKVRHPFGAGCRGVKPSSRVDASEGR